MRDAGDKLTSEIKFRYAGMARDLVTPVAHSLGSLGVIYNFGQPPRRPYAWAAVEIRSRHDEPLTLSAVMEKDGGGGDLVLYELPMDRDDLVRLHAWATAALKVTPRVAGDYLR